MATYPSAMSRGPLHAHLAAGVLLLSLVMSTNAQVGRSRAAEAPVAGTAALRARAAALSERRERDSTTGAVAIDALRADLVELAGQLEVARLDSLAADTRLHAAHLLTRLGRRPEAEQQIYLALAGALRARDSRRQMRARVLLADMRVSADPVAALRTIEEALPAAHTLGDDELLGDLFATQSHALQELGQFQDGLLASRRAAAHYADAGNPREQMLALCQCSQALRFLTRHAEARAITDSVIALARASNAARPLARALTESASLSRTIHRFPEALAAISEAIKLNHQCGDVPNGRSSRMTRARLYQYMGKFGESAADLDTMLASPDVQRSLTTLVRVAGLRARALASLGRAAEAESLLAGVAARYERFRAGLADEEDRAGVGEHAAELYMAWTRVKLALGRPEEAWQALERGRGTSLESRLDVGGVPVIAELQARLALSKSALVEYDNVDPTTGSVFVIWGAGVRGFPLKIPMTLGDLNAVLDAVSAPEAAAAADSSAARLAQALLQDVYPSLGPEIKHLFIVPPTRLESLPFEALPLPGAVPAGALGERFGISYVASAGVLLALDRRGAPARGITILADPEIDPNQPDIAAIEPALRGAILRPLPGARLEAKLLAEPGATMLLGRDATLVRLLASPPAAVLHIATHAFDDPKSAARGGLVFAGGEPMLTPARLESLTVAADLVTLSACGTLGSTNYAGEGRFGLARAFLASGARAVLSTRWEVSDRGAARFMEEFYAGLRAGLPRDQSLTRARDRLRKEGFPPRDCWAFLLMGVGDLPVAHWARRARGKSDRVRK